MDYPEYHAIRHLRDQHRDVLDRQGNLRPGETIDNHYQELKRIVGRVRTT